MGLHLRPDHESELFAFDQVIGALGRTGQRELGLHSVDIDTIIGSVDRVGDFDRWFRPRPPVDRQGWIDMDRAGRTGAIIPPIEVYRVGHLHFVCDGHHRVSVARAHGQRSIDAYVTEVTTPSSHHPIAVPPQNPDTTSRRRFTRRVEVRASDGHSGRSCCARHGRQQRGRPGSKALIRRHGTVLGTHSGFGLRLRASADCEALVRCRDSVLGTHNVGRSTATTSAASPPAGRSGTAAADSVRDFWRSTDGTLADFVTRIAGSANLYNGTRRRPSASVNPRHHARR